MSWSKSPLAFNDVKGLFEQALMADKGIKVTLTSHAQAVALRARFNYFRKYDRECNRTIYSPENPMHQRSVYDILVLRIPPKDAEDANVLYIEHRKESDYNVETL